MTSPLFSPFVLRGLSLRNRIAFSPMLMYMAGPDGHVTDRHFVHYGARALGGAALIMSEVVAVIPRGRISPADLGLWEDGQVDGLSRVSAFLHESGAAFGVQLAHAGRKSQLASRPQAPSELPYAPDQPVPEAIDETELATIREAYVAAAKRAAAADVDLIGIRCQVYFFWAYTPPTEMNLTPFLLNKVSGLFFWNKVSGLFFLGLYIADRNKPDTFSPFLLETFLRYEVARGSGGNFASLIGSLELDHEVCNDLQKLRQFRNRWVHVAEPWDDHDLLGRSVTNEQELEDMAILALRSLGRVFSSV